jgi:RNA polymerase sigma-70 factor (ECF subfamily)
VGGRELLGEGDSLRRFEEVVLPHLPACYNLARWLLGRGPDAEDCVQDALLRALRAFAQFRGGDCRPWLLAIVRNTCYTLLRRRSSAPFAPPSAAAEPKDPSPNPEASLLRKSAEERLRRALEALPIEFREVLLLKEFEGLSYKEIADVAEIPIGTVMSRLSRARQRLQECLGSRGEAP